MKQLLKFIAKCGIVSVLTLLLLFLLNYRYKQTMDDPYSDAHKFDFMNTVYNNIQISSIGSSHGEYSFYFEELTKQSGYECFNFAMSSQTYNYDYAILSMYKKNLADNGLMFIPVSYFSFNNEIINETEKEFLSAKYYTFLSPKYVPDYDLYVDLVTHIFPVLTAGEDITKIFPKLSLKASAAEAPYVPTPEEFTQKGNSRYERHFADKEDFFLPERIDNLYDIIDFCRQKGITPVLITTPYTTYYSGLVSDLFKQEFYSTINTIAESTGTSYYDYSEDTRFSDHLEYFSDADHLNGDGSILFMDTIQKEIPEFRDFLQNTTPLHAGDPSWLPAE